MGVGRRRACRSATSTSSPVVIVVRIVVRGQPTSFSSVIPIIVVAGFGKEVFGKEVFGKEEEVKGVGKGEGSDNERTQ